MRWCGRCRCWFHRDCLEPNEARITADTQPPALYYGRSPSLQKAFPLFSKALQSPIQRVPPHVWQGTTPEEGKERRYPFSFEIVISEARKMLGTTPDQLRLPANEHTWLMYNMGFGTDLSDDKEDVVAEVERRIQQLECLSIPNLYQCGKCEWVV